MKVEVTIRQNRGPDATRTVVIADATNVMQDGGHLLVKKVAGASQKTLAIYAPGHWVSAEVVD